MIYVHLPFGGLLTGSMILREPRLSALGAKELTLCWNSPNPRGYAKKPNGGQQPSIKYQLTGREELWPQWEQWTF